MVVVALVVLWLTDVVLLVRLRPDAACNIVQHALSFSACFAPCWGNPTPDTGMKALAQSFRARRRLMCVSCAPSRFPSEPTFQINVAGTRYRFAHASRYALSGSVRPRGLFRQFAACAKCYNRAPAYGETNVVTRVALNLASCGVCRHSQGCAPRWREDLGWLTGRRPSLND